MSSSEHEIEKALERKVGRQALITAACFMLAFGLVNATTILSDAARNGTALEPLRPFIDELSSIGVCILLFPLVLTMARRFPPAVDGWLRVVAIHVAGSLAFSALHIAGMVAVRKLLYPLLLSERYVFFGDVTRELVYEYRKDVLTYALFVLVTHLLGQLAEQRREIAVARGEARQSGRLTLKCGGRTIWVPADSFERAEAAGNYVEVRAGGRNHLARITMASLESMLREAGADVVRIHRSHLVNRARITEIEPTGDGDFRTRLDDGTVLRGSRRYRAELGA